MTTKKRPFRMLLLSFAATAMAQAGCGGSVASAPSPDASATDGAVTVVPRAADDDGGNETVTSGQSGSSGGRCGPTPKQLVDFNAVAAQTNALGISAGTPFAVDATSLYLVMGYTLMQVPIEGGSPSILVHLPDAQPNLSQDIQPFVTSTNVLLHYIPAGSDDEEIVSVPLQGGGSTLLTTSNGRILGFAVSGPNVYFVDSGGTKSVPANGGAVRLLTSQVASEASGLAVIGSQVVMTEGTGTIVSVPVAGGPPTTLATQQPSASFPVACGTDVCWWTGAAPNPMVSDGPGQIARLDANGELSSIPGAPSYPWALVFDGSSFFEAVGCDVCPGTIVRVPLSGTPATMTSAGFVAVDDECAYYSTIQAYPQVAGGSGMGIFSVSKAYSTCCTGGSNCVYTTGPCPAGSQ
jgi:hypothetical protein